MNAKHKPSTPLPFVMHMRAFNSPYYEITGGRGYFADGIGFSLNGYIHEDDAAYIVHACNAYPRLVGTLLAAIRILRATGHSQWEETQMAEGLLRELGEL